MTDISTTNLRRLLASLSERRRVAGLTHGFYRYPARFPPEFVRAAIRALTEPGDLVLDPFVGGGTTAVEALANGRRVVGTDLNELAVFVSRAKTVVANELDLLILNDWAGSIEDVTRRSWSRVGSIVDDLRVPWTIRRTLGLALESAAQLSRRRVRILARASLLRVGQWALDGRRRIPSRAEFLSKHRQTVMRMCTEALSFAQACRSAFGLPNGRIEENCRVLNTSADGAGSRRVLPDSWGKPRLIVTSPPYHGVHILYHRWQVRGRRETGAPYWVSGSNDGYPGTHYTFGSRVRTGSAALSGEYFAHALDAFGGLAKACDQSTLVVQLVGFSEPKSQLPVYLEMMKEAGFDSVLPQALDQRAGAPRRHVPNRKWYLDALRRFTHSSREFLLVHKLAD